MLCFSIFALLLTKSLNFTKGKYLLMSVFEQSVVNVIFVTYYVELFDVLTIKVLYS